jgi:hypothetical protein
VRLYDLSYRESLSSDRRSSVQHETREIAVTCTPRERSILLCPFLCPHCLKMHRNPSHCRSAPTGKDREKVSLNLERKQRIAFASNA